MALVNKTDSTNEKEILLSGDDLKEGVYLIFIETDSELIREKLIIR